MWQEEVKVYVIIKCKLKFLFCNCVLQSLHLMPLHQQAITI